jgi:hypothetical protein
LGAIDRASGTVSYTPNPGYSGHDSFTYNASNVAGASDPATATMTIPPSCMNVASSTPALGGATSVALSCTGPAGVPLSYAVVTLPAHGTLGAINQANGTVTYTSQAGYLGSDSFTYQASDADGASNAATATMTVPPAHVAVSLGPVSLSGASAVLPITCDGTPGINCTGAATFTARVKMRGNTIIAAGAGDGARTARPRLRTVTVTVGRTAFAVPSGTSVRLRTTLNATGKQLLGRFYKLRAQLTLSGTTALTRPLTFSYRVIDAHVRYSWSFFSSGYTAVVELTPLALPHGSRIEVTCRGRGCPFARRALKPHGRRLALAPLFGHANLAPGAVVTVIVSAPASVAQVSIFTMRNGRGPSLVVRCLPPGSGHAVPCA